VSGTPQVSGSESGRADEELRQAADCSCRIDRFEAGLKVPGKLKEVQRGIEGAGWISPKVLEEDDEDLLAWECLEEALHLLAEARTASVGVHVACRLTDSPRKPLTAHTIRFRLERHRQRQILGSFMDPQRVPSDQLVNRMAQLDDDSRPWIQRSDAARRDGRVQVPRADLAEQAVRSGTIELRGVRGGVADPFVGRSSIARVQVDAVVGVLPLGQENVRMPSQCPVHESRAAARGADDEEVRRP